MSTPATAPRTHVVMVPGFGGFDALGQMPYYVGVTEHLARWHAAHPTAPELTLHYFDNLPTAGVATRARRLLHYLRKRVERNEFREGDRVALVGHSTGGLDIRCALWGLATPEGRAALALTPRELADDAAALAMLARIERVMFVSVPQFGTNIADVVAAHPHLYGAFTHAVARAVASDPQSARADLLRALAHAGAAVGKAQLFRAVDDALREADDQAVADDPAAAADAREAYAHLLLYTRHMARDQHAIADLTAAVPQPAARIKSPAHFTDAERAAELARWREHGIRARSIATRAPSPYARAALADAAPLSLDPRTWPPATPRAEPPLAHTDAVYRWAYRACAAGPFAPRTRAARALGSGAPVELAGHDNDGVVNTASMLWPDGDATLLVEGDHGDVIGHFTLEPRAAAADAGESAAAAPIGREYARYDLFASGAGFDQGRFERVWNEVFAFCAESA